MTVSRDIEGSNIIIKPQDKASGMKSLSWGEKNTFLFFFWKNISYIKTYQKPKSLQHFKKF